MNSGIYYIQNKITKELYIGQSKDLRLRRNRHFSHLRKNKHQNPHLQNSFNKYGEENFDYAVIQYCKESELDELEIAYMNLFNVKKHGFNISDGGHDGGHKKEYAHIKLSSFNRYNQRMYALVYKNQMIRSIDISFLKHLMDTYFDESLYLKEGYSFDDLKKEAKNRMRTNSVKEVRIVNRGGSPEKRNYTIKYGNKKIKTSIDIYFLKFLIFKYFNANKLLKKGFSIEDIRKETRYGDYAYVRKRIKTNCA